MITASEARKLMIEHNQTEKDALESYIHSSILKQVYAGNNECKIFTASEKEAVNILNNHGFKFINPRYGIFYVSW